MTAYRFTVTFTADRPLTDSELAYLTNTVAVQVEEPWTINDDGEWKEATYRTANVVVQIGKNERPKGVTE